MGSLIDQIQPPGPVFLDTAPVIYFIENHASYSPLLQPVFAAVDRGLLSAISSVISLSEVLVQPLRKNAGRIAEAYRELLCAAPNLRLLEITADVAERAAAYRAKYGFKLPDALQLAVAVAGGATVFLTNDDELRRFRGIPIVVLRDFLPGRLF